jgi:hypothetical protein
VSTVVGVGVGVISGAVPVPVPVMPDVIVSGSVAGVSVGTTTAESEVESAADVDSADEVKIPPGPKVIPPVEVSGFGLEDSVDVVAVVASVGTTTTGGRIPVDPGIPSDDEDVSSGVETALSVGLAGAALVDLPLVGNNGAKAESKNEVPVVSAVVVVVPGADGGSCLALVVEKPNKSDKDREDIKDVCATGMVGRAVVS